MSLTHSETPARSPQTAAELLADKWPTLRSYWPHLATVSAKQAAFLCLDQIEAFFGGAAGPGKSDALLAGALQYVDVPGYSAIVFRRTFSDLDLPGAAMDRAKTWLRPETPWDAMSKTFTFPAGGTLTFGYLQHEGDELRYKSAEFQYIAFDELTQFQEQQYEFLFSRLRAVETVPVPLRMRAASNPGDVGHGWVKRRFITHRDPTVIFIPARLDDHPDQTFKTGYRESLAKLDPVTRRQYEEGDWDAAAGLAYTIQPDHLVTEFRLEDAMDRFEALDYGFNGAPWCLWAVDYEGNLVAADLRYWKDRLPSDITPEIVELRKQHWGLTNTAIADPSLWHRTGGKNRWGDPAKLADEFSDNGIQLTAGNNDPRAGMARIRELLKLDGGDPERGIRPHLFPAWHPRAGEPGSPRVFFVMPQVQRLVDELREAPLQPLSKADGGEKVDPDWESRHGHACFVAGTLIATEDGETPIEAIRPGQRVWTRKGLKPVIAAGCTGLRDVFRVPLSNGLELVGTADHPVWANDAWRPLSTLRYGDKCLPSPKTPSALLRPLNASRTSTRDVSTSPSTDNLLPAGTSTIATETRSTTTSAISRQSRRSTTSRFTAGLRRQRDARPAGATTQRFRLRISLSRQQNAERISRECVASGHTTIDSARFVPATIAEARMRRGKTRRLGSVQTLANLLGAGRRESITKNGAALCADSRSPSTATTARFRADGSAPGYSAQKPAPGSRRRSDTRRLTAVTATSSPPRTPTCVQMEHGSVVRVTRKASVAAKSEPVFNLTVADAPEYFANGVLVHNCAMARYAVMSRPAPSTEPEEPLPDPRAERLRRIEREREAARPRYQWT